MSVAFEELKKAKKKKQKLLEPEDEEEDLSEEIRSGGKSE